MSSTTQIVNVALTLLGEGHILSLDDNTKPAREAKIIYEPTVRALLGAYNWSFAKTRAQLPELSSAPLFQYRHQYQLPTDCLRLVMVGDAYVGIDLTDYRGMPTEEYAVEDNKILTDYGAPLNIKYVRYIEDPNKFSSNFEETLSARLADRLCEVLTQSDQKRERATAEFNRCIRAAIRSNAIELPPTKLPDDEWLISRL
jgi:hypothetical protein